MRPRPADLLKLGGSTMTDRTAASPDEPADPPPPRRDPATPATPATPPPDPAASPTPPPDPAASASPPPGGAAFPAPPRSPAPPPGDAARSAPLPGPTTAAAPPPAPADAPAPPAPGGDAPAGAPTGGVPVPGRRLGRTAVLVTVATAGLLLCGGGALTYWLVTREPVGEGAADPVAATEQFLRAVYQERDAGLAAEVTCPQVEDRGAVAARITEITETLGRHGRAAVSWSAPQVAAGATPERAELAVTLTVTTSDEREARQGLRVTTVRDGAWYVCEVTAAS